VTICPHFGVCGGCSRQDKPYAQQLSDKENSVRKFLKDLPIQTFHPILPSPETNFYRNKMEYSFGDERDIEIFSGNSKLESRNMTMNKTHLGLHPKGRFAIVTPTPECRLLSTESQEILQAVADWANDYQVSIYVRKSNEGNLRHLVIREGKNTGERMVNLVAKTPTPHIDELAERLEALRDKITTFMWTAYDGLSDVAHGGDVKIYWGHGMITEQYGGLLLSAGFPDQWPFRCLFWRL
jgi:23S rRNA (uracil1939-C5)-methyltransferase